MASTQRWLGLILLACCVAGIGCRSTSTRRSGVHSIETTTLREGLLHSVAESRGDAKSEVRPASYTTPVAKSPASDCGH